MHLRRIGIDAVHPVINDGVRLPTVPQRAAGPHYLVSVIVAQVRIHQVVQPKILRLAVLHRCDDVPRRPTLADVVQRGESARDMERWIKRSGHCHRKSEMPRRAGHDGQQLDGLEHVDLPAVAQHWRIAVVVELHQRQCVHEEHPSNFARSSTRAMCS